MNVNQFFNIFATLPLSLYLLFFLLDTFQVQIASPDCWVSRQEQARTWNIEQNLTNKERRGIVKINPQRCKTVSNVAGLFDCRSAREEEQCYIRLLSRAIRGHHLHCPHQKENSLLLLQSDRALRPHLQHGAARLHAAPGFRREINTR